MITAFGRIRPERFFLFWAILLHVSYMIVAPPFQSPDEFNHFYRALQLSEGKLIADREGNRLGGYVPACVDELTLPFKVLANNQAVRFSTSKLKQSFGVQCSDETIFKDFPNTANYSLVSYLPQAAALFVSRTTGASLAVAYLAGRLAILVVWLIAMFVAIRAIPVFRWLLTALLLLPMHVYISGTYSADNVTNIAAILLIAFVLRETFSQHESSVRTLILMLLLCMVLAVSKTVYSGLALLLFMIPAGNFPLRLSKAAFLSLSFALVLAIALAWSAIVTASYIPYSQYDPAVRDAVTLSAGADYHLQKIHLSEHPLFIFRVLANTLFSDPAFYLKSYIGNFGMYLSVPLRGFPVTTSFAVLALLALTDTSRLRLSTRHRIIMFAAVLISVVMLVISQHLTWNTVGKDTLEHLQGRYLIPVLPLVFMLIPSLLSHDRRYLQPALLLVIVAVNLYTLKRLYRHFIRSSYPTAISFECGFEKKADRDFFATSASNIKLHGATMKTDTISRRGGSALLLPPGQAGGMLYFKDLRKGDLVEIEAWKKGDAGRLVVTGCAEGCGDYFFDNSTVLLRDEQGWGKLNMTFEMPLNCGNGDVYFYLDNPGNSAALFDDLSFSLKKRPQEKKR